MNRAEQLNDIYRHLPSEAQQEALDFLLFLQQRYGEPRGGEPLPGREEAVKHSSIRDNPAFGMWSDLQGSSRERLNEIRRRQWDSP